MKVKIFVLFLILFLAGASFISVRYYSYVFSKHVHGLVVGIDRVTQPTTIIGGSGQLPNSQIFSFAIAIKEPKGEIFTASSEDRQWAVVEKGQCVEADYFPYPPWQLDKAGTYYGARLLRLYDCPDAQTRDVNTTVNPSANPKETTGTSAITSPSAKESGSPSLKDAPPAGASPNKLEPIKKIPAVTR